MFLQKVEIQGFKSFAAKTVLEFNRGLTAIVGPNGAGKSNVADAIRWVLGEQALKVLRGKRAEDVIFAGSDKKGRAGMAEVSIYLNNEDGQAPIDYAEVVITRRVFRDGQSEYLLNQNSVRLQDINLLLARANVGQRSYSVIGQGMIDSVLLASPAECKEFFEEATGVKQYQLKREQSINKLVATYENLEQAKILLQEIEPQLKILTRQIKRLEKREELESSLRVAQKKYYSYRYTQLAGSYRQVDEALSLKVSLAKEQEVKVNELRQQLSQLEAVNPMSQIWRDLPAKQADLRASLSQLTREQALAQAAVEIGHLKRGEGEIALLKQRSQELAEELRQGQFRVSEINSAIKSQQAELRNKLSDQARIASWFTSTPTASRSGVETELLAIVNQQQNLAQKLEQAKSLNEVKLLVKAAIDIYQRLRVAVARWQETGVVQPADWDKYLSERDQLGREIGAVQGTLAQQAVELANLATRSTSLQGSLLKIKQSLQTKQPVNQESGSIAKLANDINQAEQELKAVEAELSEVYHQAETTKANLFRLQKDLDMAQKLEQTTNQESHGLELEKARLEIKLEDLEREMVQEASLELIHEIKAAKAVTAINEGEVALEIKKTKGQLELTGGLEPEVVTDYEQTKTRYDFLHTQTTDLEQAVHSLESIIHDLDETIGKRFLASFRAINEKFAEYFKLLFLGGKSQLVLQKNESTAEETEFNDATESEAGEEPKLLTAREKFLANEKVNASLFSGVEIQATPGGKKLSNINALSGGEKALTSIALICAIISFNPSPFVVLDEVDAALDESNSERFAGILDVLMAKTQFVVITHNRATMKRAAVLYGVTMGEDGVSKLLSVKLEEAKEIAGKKKEK